MRVRNTRTNFRYSNSRTYDRENLTSVPATTRYLRFTYSTRTIRCVSSFFHREIYEFPELGRIARPLSSLFLLCRETIFGYRRSTPLRYSYTRYDLPFGRNASGNKSVSRWKTRSEEEREKKRARYRAWFLGKTRALLDNDRQRRRSRSTLVERTTIKLYCESFSNIDRSERKDNRVF